MDYGVGMWSLLGRMRYYVFNHRRHLPVRRHICLKEMLKRPKEVTFEFPQPNAPYPPSQRSGALIGPSGVGKTTTAIAMLMGPYRNIYSRVYVFSQAVLLEWIQPGMHGGNTSEFICKFQMRSRLCGTRGSLLPWKS